MAVRFVKDEILREQALERFKGDPLEGYLQLKRFTTFPNKTSSILPNEMYTEINEEEWEEILSGALGNKRIIPYNILRNAIIARYNMYSYTLDDFPDKGIIDSLIPSIYCKYSPYPQELKDRLMSAGNNNVFTLSRYFEYAYQLPRVPITDQLNILGYSISDIKTLMKQVKRKNLNVTFIGFGGLCLNVLENLIELSNKLDIKELFEVLHIFEADGIEHHNTFRFSTANLLRKLLGEKSVSRFALTDSYNVPKTDLISPYALKSISQNSCVHRNYLKDESLNRSTIYFGAPNIATRKMLFERGVPFYCGTHQNNSVALFYKPYIDDTLIRETYGKIDLTSFFLNMLDITVQFLKALTNDQEPEKDSCLYSNTFNTFGKLSHKGYVRPKYNTEEATQYAIFD